ncbi:protein OCTOPUS-like [Vigna unguiculata]|uniref:protein OCTOPUS-like n=1 Tax=Vigna unguiculata TaxID=3917 RepID=UPI0010168A52|nr:protein OCTOPUS-like [Vigna unguiculata]
MTPKSHRLSACHRHPTAPITGFCALCLRERLAGIPSDHSPPSPSLRRSKSCSRPTASDAAAVADPRRRSCEVRPRSSLSDLFNRDDLRKSRSRKHASEVTVSNDGDGDADEESKTVKEFIDLELQLRKRNGARDSRTFWNAAAEKFKKWKWKHRAKKNADADSNVKRNAEKRRARGLRETQSEVGECNLGRRSCDVDSRFSIEAGRISFDCPRASWDGCLIGKSCSRLSPMLSVDEDSNSINSNSNSNNNSVGLGSSGDGRRSFGFDRSSSRRRQSIAGLDELKLTSNSNVNARVSPKVSPATFYGAKLLITEKELMDSYVRSSADAVESGCVMESDSKDVSGAANGPKGVKKLQKWRDVWSKLGLVQRTERRDDRSGEEECDSSVVVDKPLAESLQRLRRVVNVQASEPVGQKLMRSYSVSCRSPCRTDGFADDSESKGSNGRHEFTFQRNRSVRYSPNNPDTGLLRFYLTPSKSYKRSKAGKSSVKDLHSATRSGL